MDELLAESQKLAQLGSWEWDSGSNHVIWSDQLYRIFGLEPQTFPASVEGYLARLHPDDRHRVALAIDRALRECSSFDHEERIIRADGEVRILHSRGRAICDNACHPVKMVGTCQDVTELRTIQNEREKLLAQERKAMEEGNASRQLLTSILKRVSDGFVSLDTEWRYTHVNEKAGEMLGRRPEQLIGKHIWTEFPEGVGQKFYDAYHQAMRDQVPVYLEDFYPPWNRCFENRIYPSKDGLSIFFQDVTDRRRADEALRESEDRFREIAENVSEVFWVTSADFKTVLYVSPAFETVFGIPAAPLENALNAWMNVVHPDDRDMLREQIQKDMNREPIGGTYRILRPDGSIRWILWRGCPIRDLAGNIVRVTGFSEDITELKETEQALREAESRLAKALHESQDRVVQLEEQSGTRTAFERLVGKSTAMQEVYRKLRLAAQSDVTVLLTGESGTGKELASAAVHSLSERKAKPFVAVNCSAIPETLLESELFGHVKGAFTGAIRDKAGLFQMADGGTLFLDEVGDMAASLQVKVLRALQEREVRRVGDERVSKVDVRIIAATNRDLAKLVAAGKIREDFYYRIRVFDIVMPPLRDRHDDIALLVRHFLREFGARGLKTARGVDAEALHLLMNHSWPGNVRELRNAIEHAIVTAAGAQITGKDLPSDVRAQATPETRLKPEQVVERQRVLDALEESGWNRTKAAALLGTSRVTVWKKMRRFGLQPSVNGEISAP